MAGIEFKDLARLLTCRELAETEGMKLRGGRAQCPFHGGEHFNLAFLRDGHCHCHVCGRTADVVQLASALWRMNQRDAAAELNARFKLGLTGETMTPAERERREQARREARDLQALVKQAEAQKWSAAADELREAERAAAQFTMKDADNAATWAAVARLGKAQDTWNAMQAAGRNQR